VGKKLVVEPHLITHAGIMSRVSCQSLVLI